MKEVVLENGTRVRDIYGHKKTFENCAKEDFDDLSMANNRLIQAYIQDMYLGKNVTSKKRGSRGFQRLNTLRSKVHIIAFYLQKYHKVEDLTKTSEYAIEDVFQRMRDGRILKRHATKQRYTSTVDYVKAFKAFWHWHMRAMKKKNVLVPDITEEIATNKESSRKWNYLTKEDMERMASKAKPEYKTMIYLMFDSGIRSPKELMNLRASDVTKDAEGTVYLEVRPEASKTFHRKFKLLLAGKLVLDHIQATRLKPNDYLFTKGANKINQYLKRLSNKTLNADKKRVWQSKGGVTMYDFRHSSACYWINLIKNHQQIMYRFGWKDPEKIHYYTEFMGLKDEMREEDLISDTDRQRLEKDLQNEQNKRKVMEDDLQRLTEDFSLLKESIHNMLLQEAVHENPHVFDIPREDAEEIIDKSLETKFLRLSTIENDVHSDLQEEKTKTEVQKKKAFLLGELAKIDAAERKKTKK